MLYSERLDRATTMALEGFRGIPRKDTTIPYITHLFAVTALVGEAGGDEDQLVAAMLHDWLEDVEGATEEALEQAFGPRVRRLVVALSDTTEHPKPPWLQRKERYRLQLREQPAEVKLISCADKLHNCSGLVRDVQRDGPGTFDRFRGGLQGTLWYYAAMAEALQQGWSHWLLGDLHRSVHDLHQHAGIEVGQARPPRSRSTVGP
ncbi:MAG TPA: bifunctional (p)ppGpp synthetase/guanosine-3',5'-bis(diphosphate) 3'-pyrophosphohydrolase [Deltaproteobacteria bacterium]|nr:bifunctional (p)ppGpp synthetase/guanosine-3',5'-bis(diphosphate) 3'-pyrophosphohydrolase [Deltaproteobacteria bacterium]